MQSKVWKTFGNRMLCSWRFLTSNKLEQFKFKLERNIGIRKHAGKVRINIFLVGIEKKEYVCSPYWVRFCVLE